MLVILIISSTTVVIKIKMFVNCITALIPMLV